MFQGDKVPDKSRTLQVNPENDTNPRRGVKVGFGALQPFPDWDLLPVITPDVLSKKRKLSQFFI